MIYLLWLLIFFVLGAGGVYLFYHIRERKESKKLSRGFAEFEKFNEEVQEMSNAMQKALHAALLPNTVLTHELVSSLVDGLNELRVKIATAPTATKNYPLGVDAMSALQQLVSFHEKGIERLQNRLQSNILQKA